MQYLQDSTVTDQQAPDMELRLFRQLSLAASLMTLLIVFPVDFLIHQNPTVVLADLSLGLAVFFLFLQARRGRYHLKTLFYLYLLNLNVCWFFEGGSHGSVPLYFFDGFIYILIFFRGRMRFLLHFITLADAVSLFWTEPVLSRWVVPYADPTDRTIDLTLSLVMSIVSCTLMVWAIIAKYDREQRRLKSLNADLERSMAERVEAERSLRAQRELLNAVIDGTSDAVYAKDVEGRYVLFSSAAARMIGKTAQQALGKNDTELFPPDEAERLMANDREIMACGKVRTVENAITGASGAKIVVQATKGPLLDGNGGIVGVVGISRDVTEHRRAEEKIRELNADLDRRVTERTARLRAAIKEQESFSYSISHDLRAPLRHINSYSAILQEEFGDSLNAQAHGYLDRIRHATRNMGRLIDDLLELSRVGRAELVKTTVELSELARTICFTLKQSEPHRKAEFVLAPDLTVHGDRVLLRQALENLLENAWKYTRYRDFTRIELGSTRVGDDETYFVRDNGVGFDMAYRDKLFGAFQRLHGSEFEGTGIGLATVKRIVKLHGGSVWAQGEIDRGATFSFTLR